MSCQDSCQDSQSHLLKCNLLSQPTKYKVQTFSLDIIYILKWPATYWKMFPAPVMSWSLYLFLVSSSWLHWGFWVRVILAEYVYRTKLSPFLVSNSNCGLVDVQTSKLWRREQPGDIFSWHRSPSTCHLCLVPCSGSLWSIYTTCVILDAI